MRDALIERALGQRAKQDRPHASALPIVRNRDGGLRLSGAGPHVARDADPRAVVGEGDQRLVVVVIDAREVVQLPVSEVAHGRIGTLRGNEPWPGYDELTVSALQSALGEADDDRVTAVRAYERAHKARAGVLKATELELTNA